MEIEHIVQPTSWIDHFKYLFPGTSQKYKYVVELEIMYIGTIPIVKLSKYLHLLLNFFHKHFIIKIIIEFRLKLKLFNLFCAYIEKSAILLFTYYSIIYDQVLENCANQQGESPEDLAWNIFRCGYDKKAVLFDYMPARPSGTEDNDTK